jgi:putative Flp pilus-assembly TadE/G-like protein
MRKLNGPDSEGGQAIVMIAIVFMALLFVVGLAIDSGQLFSAKRTQQEAADAAAFAGAVVLYQGGTVLQATTAAITDAATNGFVNGVNSTTVTVNGSATASSNAPTAGAYAGESPVKHVEVIIVRQVKTTLVPAEAAFNPVRARGVAGAEAANNGYPIMALGTSCAAPGITVSPNLNLEVYGGGIISNSCNTTSVYGFTSGQDLQICALAPAPCSPNAYTFDTVGGTTGDTFPAGVTVHTGAAIAADPYAGYPKPDGKSYNGVSTLPTNPALISGTNTAPEGIYTSELTGVALCHGIYILKGGGLGGDISRDTNGTHVDPNTGTACDGKVLIYNTTSNFPSSIGTCSDVGDGGNHPIVLRPMTTGSYANMGVYQDPACTSDLRVDGSGSLDAGGTIYLPNGAIRLDGNNATIDGGQLIAKTIDLQNGDLNIIYTAGTTATPILPRLAE